MKKNNGLLNTNGLCHYRVLGAHPKSKGLIKLDGTSQTYVTMECDKSSKSIKNQAC